MTDREIVKGLIARDGRVTEDFFFTKCRPLLRSIVQKVFDNDAEYDELVNELYLYLMEDDAVKLRQFQYRSTVYQWLKVLAIRFFIKKRGQLIENCSDEALYTGEAAPMADDSASQARADLQRLLRQMPNQRYAYTIQRLIVENWEPEQLAREMNIRTANLYNIKRRAMAQLTEVALKDIIEYGKH